MYSPKLFVFYLGGRFIGGNIEAHDIQFVVGNTPEECYPLLKEKWQGDPSSLHIDGYKALSYADGFDLILSNKPQDSPNSLFFVNVGAYAENKLAELHEFDFFVSRSAQEAKQKALKTLLLGHKLQHKDDLLEVDDCLELTQVGEYYIHLIPSTSHKTDEILFQGYLPIGKSLA